MEFKPFPANGVAGFFGGHAQIVKPDIAERIDEIAVKINDPAVE